MAWDRIVNIFCIFYAVYLYYWWVHFCTNERKPDAGSVHPYQIIKTFPFQQRYTNSVSFYCSSHISLTVLVCRKSWICTEACPLWCGWLQGTLRRLASSLVRLTANWVSGPIGHAAASPVAVGSKFAPSGSEKSPTMVGDRVLNWTMSTRWERSYFSC